MQIRCGHCTKTLALSPTGELPPSCPHCARPPGPGDLGPWQPLRLIASGGMGEVYLARHRELGTEVALKVLPAMPLDAVAAIRERFAREARLTAKVAHAGVVKVHGSEVAGDRPFLVLEFVAGETLRTRLGRGPVPIVDAARFAAGVADVLAAAHAHGVLHRDVKPDNVMVEPDGAVRVLDFGIARALHDDAPITRTGEIVGTPEYMAPEQLLEGPDAIDPRTDVHALGVLLFELLTGRSPFHGANVFQALKLVESLVPPPPSSRRAEVPQALDAVVGNALQKQPHDRFASAREFAAAVRAAVPELERPTPIAAAPRRVVGFLLAALLLGAVAGAWLLPRVSPPPPTAPSLSGPDAERRTVAAAAPLPDVASGLWSATWLAAKQRAEAGEAALLATAREAFVLTHLTWLLANDLPLWLAAHDERARQQLFGDPLEPVPDVDPLAAAQRALLAGDGAAAERALATLPDTKSRRRAALLAVHLQSEDPGRLALRHAELALVGDACSELLAARLQSPEARARTFAAIAERLPLTAPEHWLARASEQRDVAGAGDHAAEMAWLQGAGELAVLLDGALAVVGPHERLAPRGTSRFAGLHARLVAADALDSPASALLADVVQFLHRDAGQRQAARAFRSPLRREAARWVVRVAATNPTGRWTWLQFAAALGATPDYAQAPWDRVPAESRADLDAEVQRGR